MTVELGQMEQPEKTEEAQAPAQPAQPPAPATQEIPDLGLTIAPISETLRQAYGIAAGTNGVVVTSVNPSGIAAERGLTAGDVIAEVDQEEATETAAVAKKVEDAKKAGRSSVLLFIARKEDRRFVALKLK